MQIEHKGYTITQTENGHIWIGNGNNGAHISCDEILTEEELVAKADEFIQIDEIFDELFEEDING